MKVLGNYLLVKIQKLEAKKETESQPGKSRVLEYSKAIRNFKTHQQEFIPDQVVQDQQQ